MTPQLVPLFLSPMLCAINVYAVVVGFSGSDKLHKLARVFGIAGMCLFSIAILAMIDLTTQVWVMRIGSMSKEVYLACGMASIVCIVVSFALVLSIKARRA